MFADLSFPWRVVAAFVLASLACIPAPAAEGYPTRPVHIVVPTGPGGPTDILARLLAERLSVTWGQGVVVDNKAGAAQMIGADAVAKAAPDGYTLLLASDSSITINPGLYPKMTYDPQKDLRPVSKLVVLPLVLVVHPSVPARSVTELVELARGTPGKLNFGSGGGTSRMGAELFRIMTGTEMTHVPYKGSGPMVMGLLGNEVQLAFDGVSSSLPQIRAGKLRVLAVSGARRLPALPDVPTVAEAGVAGYESGAWLGLLAPAQTPPSIVARLQADVGRVLRDPQIAQRLSELGMDVVLSTPEAFAHDISAETAKWKNVIRRAGITAD